GSQLRQVTYDAVAITPGAKATVTFTLGGANTYLLLLDRDGDGVADQTLQPAVSEIVPDTAPALVSAIQTVTGAPDLSQFGQLLGLLFSEEVSSPSSQSEADAASLTHYQVDGNQVLGAALQPGGR